MISPVGLKEAALDSPTFRATTLHFAEQIELLEKWLEGYAKAATKLAAELSSLEPTVGSFLSQFTSPVPVSEAVIDHDYTLLAMGRCGDSSKEVWNGLIAMSKKLESLVAEPIRNFIQGELRAFKVGCYSLVRYFSSTSLTSQKGYPTSHRSCTETLRFSPSQIFRAVEDEGAVIASGRCVSAPRSSKGISQGVNGLLRSSSSDPQCC